MYEDWNNELWSSSLSEDSSLNLVLDTSWHSTQCAPGRVSDVEKFVRNNLRKAVHIETYAGIVYMYD